MRLSPRQLGTSPRQLGTSPRQLGTHPRAGSDQDQRSARRAITEATTAWRADHGQPWCATCDDTGLAEITPGHWGQCPDRTSRHMTSREALIYLANYRPDRPTRAQRRATDRLRRT